MATMAPLVEMDYHVNNGDPLAQMATLVPMKTMAEIAPSDLFLTKTINLTIDTIGTNDTIIASAHQWIAIIAIDRHCHH